MPTDKWTDWTLETWNSVLVDAVFGIHPGVSREISRIDATSQFLARLVGADPSNSEAIRDRFFECFAGSPHRVRALLDSRAIPRSWTPRSSHLPFYVQLHLSLLVASADEQTHDIGNFRDRLATRLDMPSQTTFSLTGLADLWRATEEWTHQTQRQAIRRLKLPDPGSETLIGFSKRLAFPTYRDQVHLAQMLSSNQLDATSAPNRILEVVGAQRHQFTEWFQSELREFHRLLYARKFTEARQSPFWGAVSDISWQEPSRRTQSSEQDLQLELDVVDPYAPQLCLLSRKSLAIGARWRTKLRIPAISGWRYEITNGVQPTSSILDSLVSDRLPKNGYLKMALRRGLIAFARDEYGRWVDTPTLDENEIFWVVLRKPYFESNESLSAFTKRATYKVELPSANHWMVVGPMNLSTETRSVLVRAFPHDDLFRIRLREPSIRLRGGLRLAEGYLFVWPELPDVLISEADRIEWSGTVGSTQELPMLSMRLIKDEESAKFKFQEDDAALVVGPARVKLRALDRNGIELDEAQFDTVPYCQSTQIKLPNDLSGWLVVGDAGQLQGAADASTDSELLAEYVRSGIKNKPIAHFNGMHEKPKQIAIEEIPDVWWRAIEILNAHFVRATGITRVEFFSLIQRLWNSDARTTWQYIEDLVENGIVRELYSRRWHGSSFVASPPRLHIIGSHREWTCRLVGLLSHVTRERVVGELRSLGISGFVWTDPGATVCGAFEFRTDTRSAIDSFASKLNLVPSFDDPSEVPELANWDQIFSSEPERERGEMTVWSEEARSFLQPKNVKHGPVRLECWTIEGSQPLFVLKMLGKKWSTHSRKWALLAHGAVARRTIGTIEKGGTLAMGCPTLSMPPVVHNGVLAWGGGVCFRTSSGHRIYPAGQTWAPSSILLRWIEKKAALPNSNRQRHIERLQIALSRRLGPQAARRLAQRYRLGGDNQISE